MTVQMLGVFTGSAMLVCAFLAAQPAIDAPGWVLRWAVLGGWMLAVGSLAWAVLA